MIVSPPEGYVPIQRIVQGVNVEPMLAALAANPQLWNERRERTSHADSPHYGLDDIWPRYADPRTMQDDGSHCSMWYSPSQLLPVRELVFPLMSSVQGEQLGGILITRIKAGLSCKRHRDPGWHAAHYSKFAIQLSANDEQAFCFDGHRLVTAPGDIFWFNNHFDHWVDNPSAEDRVTMIVCIRTERTQYERVGSH